MGSQRVGHDWVTELNLTIRLWFLRTRKLMGWAPRALHVCAKLFQSCLNLSTLWTVAHQAPLSMRYSRQEYWSGLPCPSPGDLPDPGMELKSLMSPALAGGFFNTSTTSPRQISTTCDPQFDCYSVKGVPACSSCGPFSFRAQKILTHQCSNIWDKHCVLPTMNLFLSSFTLYFLLHLTVIQLGLHLCHLYNAHSVLWVSFSLFTDWPGEYSPFYMTEN